MFIGPQYPEYNQSELYRMNNKNTLPSFHQSQESLGRRNNRSTSPPRTPSNATSWGSSLNSANATLRRSHGSPLRPPSSKPPPPPKAMTGPPSCPPPPPPTHAPPPPPHRVNPAPPPPRLTVSGYFLENCIISSFRELALGKFFSIFSILPSSNCLTKRRSNFNRR